ncbi:hypothetical protein OG900_22875 [Streptomyces sp. NBC_00433]
MNKPLVEPLTSSPLWCLLTFRRGRSAFSGRALVFLHPDDADRVEYPNRRASRTYPRPSLLQAWQTTRADARWVSLTEYECQVEAPSRGRTRDGRAPSGATSPQTVIWWVIDPVIVAREALTEEEVARRVAADATSRGLGSGHPEAPRPPFEAGPPDPFRLAYEVQGYGIAYRLLPRAPGETSPPAGPVLPAVWGAEHHEAYRFYRDVVAGGPHGLAALWLLYHPEQAKDVLEWTVTHRSALSQPDSWEQSLASVLQSLTGADRAFLGVKFAEVLSDAGVPQGEETLNRVREVSDAGTEGAPGGPW